MVFKTSEVISANMGSPEIRILLRAIDKLGAKLQSEGCVILEYTYIQDLGH